MVKPKQVAVARLLKPHGVRGEIEAKSLTDFADRIVAGRRLAISPEAGGRREVTIESVRAKKGNLLLRLEGVDTPEAAADLRGAILTLPVDELPPLGPDEYYHYDLLGMRVATVDGRDLGLVEEILVTGANDVYVVRGHGREVLIPAIHSVVKDVNVEKKAMIIEPMPGLIPGEADED